MTVEELIEELKAYPPDAEVMIPEGESPYYRFTNTVRSDKDYAMAAIIEQRETMYNEELAKKNLTRFLRLNFAVF